MTDPKTVNRGCANRYTSHHQLGWYCDHAGWLPVGSQAGGILGESVNRDVERDVEKLRDRRPHPRDTLVRRGGDANVVVISQVGSLLELVQGSPVKKQRHEVG